MALINCPECNKEISDKASSCPNCGMPFGIVELVSKNVNHEGSEPLKFPHLPDDLSIGQQITNWAFDAAFDGFLDVRENVDPYIPNGKVRVMLHTNGIAIWSGVQYCFQYHNSQIISINRTTHGELTKVDKSVIGRAVLGGLILGPVGALVGGMSGIGNKDKYLNMQYFILNYWDNISESAKTILIRCTDDAPIDSFIRRYEKEKHLNIEKNREPEPNTMQPWMIVALIIIFVSVIIIFIYI